MKKQIYLFFVVLTTISFNVLAQEQQTYSVNKFNITDIFILAGNSSNYNNTSSLADFKSLSNKSVLLNNNLNDFSQSNYFSTTNNSIFSVMIGLQFSDKQKSKYRTNPLLRVGLSYQTGNIYKYSLHKEVRNHYDTLISSQTGQSIYLDSINSKSYFMNYWSEQLRFDGSLIFRTNPEARWSLFAGIGISVGLSINTFTNIVYDNFNSIENIYGNTITPSSSGTFNSENFKTEQNRNKMNFGFSSYIPMGLDFRIGNKRELWKRTHIFYELRPSFNLTTIPELRTITNVNFQQGIGLRVTLK